MSTVSVRPAPARTHLIGSTASSPHRIVALFLFVSGAVALVYEVIWQRQFSLVFGAAAPATAAVLGAYFAGLGTGALVVGQLARRWPRPLRAYAVLELSVASGAILVSPLLASFEKGYPWLFQSLANHPGWFVAVRTAVAFVVLLIPTFCMGGTLPLLGEFVDRGRRHLGTTAGWLYVVNTAGAALGALAVPFYLLPAAGMTASVWFCAAVNAALALAAWSLDRRVGSVSPEAVAPVAPDRNRRPTPADTITGAGLVPASISGITTFALQVLWNRAFAQVHENSLYSFAVTVAVVILALAIGAQLARLALRCGAEPRRLVGAAWMLAGVAVLTGPWLFLRLSDGLAYLPAADGWSSHALHLITLVIAMVFAPMALLGFGLPTIMEQAGRTSGAEASRVLGRLLAANVVGSVTGALAAGYVAPLWLGLWPGVLSIGLLLLAGGLWHWTRLSTRTRSRRYAVALAACWCVSLWPAARIDLPRVRLDSDHGEKLLALTEGPHGITAVVERRGSRRIKLNNHYGLGGTASTGDERMQAHVPLLLHPAPRRVAFLGLGTGITAGGALLHPVKQLTVMELVPEVVTASRDFFRTENLGVLDDPHTRVVPDDARNFLRGSGEHFDIIIGDLVVPWRQGEGSLFTLEQFTAARRALAPGGLFCQWLPLFQLSETEVNILARTFLKVFPRAQVWRGDFSPTEPAIALIGAEGNFEPDAALVRRRLSEMRPDPTNPQLRSPEAFWMNFVGILESSDLPANETRLNEEDRPWVELLGPMLHAGGNQNALFTGRRLQTWLDQLQLLSRDRVRTLPESEKSAIAAGGVLAEMTLCLSEENSDRARAAQEQIREMLPADAYEILFP